MSAEDIKHLVKELQIIVTALESEKEQIFESIPEHKKSLEEQIKNISGTNIVLQSVPKKLSDQLESSIPQIVEQLKSVMIDELKRAKDSYSDDINNHIKFLRDSEERLEQLSKDITIINKKRIKIFFSGVVISSIISVICATSVALYMMQTFPTRVVINTPENITR